MFDAMTSLTGGGAFTPTGGSAKSGNGDQHFGAGTHGGIDFGRNNGGGINQGQLMIIGVVVLGVLWVLK